MTKRDAVIAIAVIMFLLLIATATFDVVTFTSLKTTQTAGRHTQNQLATALQHQVTARVETVGQRCQLTDQIIKVLVKLDPASDLTPFKVSYLKCEGELKTITYEAAHPVPQAKEG